MPGHTCAVRASSCTASASSDREGKDNNRGATEILEPEAWEGSSACEAGARDDDVPDAGELPDRDSPVSDIAHRASDRDNDEESPSTPDFPTSDFWGFCRDKTKLMKTDTDAPFSAACVLFLAAYALFWEVWVSVVRAFVSEAPPSVPPRASVARRAPDPWECAPSFLPPGNPTRSIRWRGAIFRR